MNISRFFKITFLVVLIIVVSACKNETKTAGAKETESQDLASEKWFVQMAQSIMLRYPESYQIDGRDTAKWDYVHGLVLKSFIDLYEMTSDSVYFDYVEGYADRLVQEDGSITTYKLEDYNIDMINAGKILFPVYEITKEEKYKRAMQLLDKQLKEHPRTSEGGFWHKKRYPYQMWLDGLYMGAPYYAEYTSSFEEGKGLDDVAKQFELIQKHAIDPESQLLYHAWDESKEQKWADQETGVSPNFWSRSLGWYAMALVDVLDYFPEDHPKRVELIQYLNQLADALIPYQDETGLWYQVPTLGDKEGNYLEASGSSMFAYAFAKGVNKGYLDAAYKDVANKAFDGLTQELIQRNEDGTITLTQVCAVAGLGGDPYRDGSYEYYINERKKDNDPKGTGPFIMAAIQLDR
ncbi:glycoside hydrolase family 88/105 protein [Leeuwenhoekiella marinoflava]|uniref:Unsaturated rhamnogalacturonyl hydrolase n=2 Tax=Leeuwenhoekiella marinoflava TaxID=988 RepID=A0A4Q0PKH5_9FLAO|nr:glycoside hydrolase family 88 protein [Leeuwenhoekiella marinoflava]RXG27614.1 unsaturated rhamnogalacturonyl hydrolase [Leeuwenhoekiella marinoflava]SHF67085.1 unsaturated rhamnogalacturonyl hydrolase [Leeuwenhoekiella marinoflava DSM 3653]